MRPEHAPATSDSHWATSLQRPIRTAKHLVRRAGFHAKTNNLPRRLDSTTCYRVEWCQSAVIYFVDLKRCRLLPGANEKADDRGFSSANLLAVVSIS